MALFLLRRLRTGYVEHDSAIIRAGSEQEAREIAEKKLQSPNGVWLKPETTCDEIKEFGPHGVVLSSFVAG
jgi:hypothetical protein